MSATGRPPNTLFEPKHYAVSYCKNIAVAVWRSRADGETAKAVLDFIDRLVLGYAQFSAVHVVEEGVGLPTPEGRDVFMDKGRVAKQRLACAGVLLPASSVVATTLRAFARTSRMLLRNDLGLVVEQDALTLSQTLCELHAARTGVRVAPSELNMLITALRGMPQ